MARIFISFRKADDRVMRERVHHALVQRYGETQVFKSGESIQPGTDYIKALLTQARACPLMLVLIGAQWIAAHDETGGRLIDREHDWVRREITTALQAGNRVLPVLLGDETLLPRPGELPADIAALGNLQALSIGHTGVEEGLARLIAAVDRTLPSLGAPNAPDPRTATPTPNVRAGAGVAVGGSVTGIVGGHDVDARGATVVSGDQHITHKRGGAAAAAAGSAGSTAAVLAALGKPFGALADWAKGHRIPAISVAVAVAVGGVVTVVISAGPTPGGGPAAVSSPTSSARPFGTAGANGSADAPPDSTSPAQSAVPDATTGTAIAQMDQSQLVYRWADGSDLVLETNAATPQSGSASGSEFAVTTYSLHTGQQLGTFTPEVLTPGPDDWLVGCIDTLVHTDKGTDVLVVEKTVVTPAQGLTPGFSTVQMSGLDPVTGSTLWTTTIPGSTGPDPNPDYCIREGETDAAITANRKYMLETETSDPYTVDLDSGSVTKIPGATGILGNLVTSKVPSETDPGKYTSLSELDPGTGAVVAKITDAATLLWFANGEPGLVSDDSVGLWDSPSNPNTGSLVAGGYSLPSGAMVWTSGNGSAWQGTIDVDPETGAAFDDGGPNASATSAVTRFSPTTGAEMWSVPNVAYCGSTNAHVYVLANGQLVTLDESSGKQSTYDPSVTTCAVVLDGALEESITGSDGSNQYRFEIG